MIKHILIALCFLALTACGGGDSDNGANTGTGSAAVKEGLFLDSAVAGLYYISGNQSGFTDNKGKFVYEVNVPVQFSIGGIVIGEATAKPVMTPLDLVEEASNELDPTVTNIVRFLQTLDNDANPDNGITITEPVRTFAAGKSLDFDQDIANFENDGNTQTIVAELTALTSAGARPLISSQQAQSHFNNTLLVRRITFTSPQDITATGDIGIWMFERDELSFDAIADWLDRGLDGRRLLEPINVLWVDFISVTKEEARERVLTFLTNSGFEIEIWPFHSRPNLPNLGPGYFGLYFPGNPDWVEQCCSPWHENAWVDASWPGSNNHGRIFPVFEVVSSTGDSVYITSGAFSQEGECTDISPTNLCITGHEFMSFDHARNEIRKSGGWDDPYDIDVGNKYESTPFRTFTTADHSGVRVFALYPFIVKITSPVDGATFSSAESISFEGNAAYENGVDLPDHSLIWESDRDGEIGRGPSLALNDLSVGTHIITLTAIDEQGATGSESVTINVTFTDADSDGFEISDGDCNDNDASIYPGANEICGDGIDQDCNGSDKVCTHPGDCEVVTSGPSTITIINDLNVGVTTFFQNAAFGSDIRPNKCEIYGYSGIRAVEFTRCNFSGDTCYENTFGLTVTVSISDGMTIRTSDLFQKLS